jgi:hypothetical protein
VPVAAAQRGQPAAKEGERHEGYWQTSVAITLDLYSHATPAMHREAASTLDMLLRKAPGQRYP